METTRTLCSDCVQRAFGTLPARGVDVASLPQKKKTNPSELVKGRRGKREPQDGGMRICERSPGSRSTEEPGVTPVRGRKDPDVWTAARIGLQDTQLHEP